MLTMAGAPPASSLVNNQRYRGWGANSFGQLGDGTHTFYNQGGATAPTPDLPVWTKIAAGGYFTLGLKADGTVWAWGNNDAGQLGTNTVCGPTNIVCGTDAPVPVVGLTGVSEIAAGLEFGLALASGKVYSWGANSHGQLGNGCKIGGGPPGGCADSTLPAAITSLGTDVVHIGAGLSHGLAIKAGVSGTGTANAVYAWGMNDFGQLGDGCVIGGVPPSGCVDHSTPVAVKDVGGTGQLHGVAQVGGGNSHSVARKIDATQTLAAWGNNTDGALGNGSSGPANSKSIPVSIPRSTGITDIGVGVGSFHTLALRSDGSVIAWGLNGSGQLGTSPTLTPFSPKPIVVAGVAGATNVAGGGFHSLAIVTGGNVQAWGDNSQSQLGNSISCAGTYCASPVRVQQYDANGNASALAGVTDVSAGYYHSLALIPPAPGSLPL